MLTLLHISLLKPNSSDSALINAAALRNNVHVYWSQYTDCLQDSVTRVTTRTTSLLPPAREAGREERQRLLRDRVLWWDWGGRGEEEVDGCKGTTSQEGSETAQVCHKKAGRKKRKPALDFKDSSPPPPPLLQDTSESHDTEEKFPEGMESLEVRADASLTSPVPSRLLSATTSDHNNIHNNYVHEEQFLPSMFGTLSEVSPSGGRNCPTHCSSIDELFEEVGYHGNLQYQGPDEERGWIEQWSLCLASTLMSFLA